MAGAVRVLTAGPREEDGPSEARQYGSIILAATEPTALSTLAFGDGGGGTVSSAFPASGRKSNVSYSLDCGGGK